MVSGILIVFGIAKVAVDYRNGFSGKVKGLISILFSLLTYPLLIPCVRECVYRTEIAAYLNEFNLLLLEMLSMNFDGSLIQNDMVTTFLAGNIDSITRIEIKLICLIGTVFISNLILALVFRLTNITNKIPLAARMNHILGALIGLTECAFGICLILAFLYAICNYTGNVVIMGLLKNDSILNYVYTNNPLIRLLFG